MTMASDWLSEEEVKKHGDKIVHIAIIQKRFDKDFILNLSKEYFLSIDSDPLSGRARAQIAKYAYDKALEVQKIAELKKHDNCFCCIYWRSGGVREIRPGWTEPFGALCRRYPDYNDKRQESDWCGEFKRREGLMNGIEFRKYGSLPISLEPAIIGHVPSKWLVDNMHRISHEDFYGSMTEDELKSKYEDGK